MIRAYRTIPMLLVLPTLLVACREAPTEPAADELGPPALDLAVETEDMSDSIHLTTDDSFSGRMIQVCLSVSTPSGWWKGVGINRTDPTVEADGATGVQCATAPAGPLTLTFWKAKGLGVHTLVGKRTFDLTGYGGHRVYLSWLAD